MHGNKHYGTQLFLYALMPTALELCWCFAVGVVIVIAQFGRYTLLEVVVHAISQSIVGAMYRSDIAAPIQRFANYSIVMTIILGLVWSVVGTIIYESVAFFVKRFTDWENANHEMHFSPFGTIERYSSTRLLLKVWLWRALIGLTALLFTSLIVPYLYHHILTGVDFYMVSVVRLIMQAAAIILVWSLILHVYVILLRFYVMRVRLFDSIIY
jgi:hypothetical protein